jgi:molybdopterin-guanine dinucleotide biosynthesis protein A
MGQVTGFVLAGGRSTRMGADKAFLEWDGGTLLAHAMHILSSITPDVRILGARQKFGKYGQVVQDEYANHGPLAGIHAALRAAASELNLILAVDMPLVETRFLQYLVQEAGKCSATVTLPRAGGGWQPLCAVYRPSFTALVEPALLQNRNKIDALFAATEVRILDEDELSMHGFSPGIFQNLNTPEDLLRLRHQLQDPGVPTQI